MNVVSLRTDEIISQDLDHYGNMLLRLAYSYMKNIYDAEDVVQEVFVQLLKNIEKLESDEYKKNWLICVARNICKNKLKSAWFKKHVELTEMPYYDEYKDSNVLNKVMQLPLKYREIIYLYYYEDYTTVEIATIIDKKEATVRSLLSRGRNILRSELKEEYDFE
ncbi:MULTISPECIES: sigma-70 family RNA polymerase sigma factor [Clostridium]|uniref:RNA polymerase sigma factor, sigma-70 family n=1 Tax=Clostridium saccharoperbutylacetonicum N1-4(HMT) TaxID=931276 RepID=M1MYW1_9CLOT|nr:MULTISPECIES: sigma-70 family RNA polymerase sigma factor [Clostridium]AGF56592.1 RNA polymerase sigma factor, sigma-70 family [Clostridium saccharoperbutylacetonicum N1-4(HMT)]AQR95266.1 ECF RNA polymerase sigma factor SigW [Clostridium saccharoperbutylacetonicum]NRT62657.1 RNA polymerase sigma-70 factor (ECF subfamily) [Clostridium saccharoperbutylacetonicum]NSB26005.1 RNA polymerase sigma-70 factor (ECF subfamily) [Clostridium saccharoperbutylacetonicum]NSB31121.1 RNA polymerase sigma-70